MVRTLGLLHYQIKHQVKKAIARAIRNRKPLTNEQKERKKKYTREYHAERYKNDEVFRERVRKDNRENQKRKYWEKDGKQ